MYNHSGCRLVLYFGSMSIVGAFCNITILSYSTKYLCRPCFIKKQHFVNEVFNDKMVETRRFELLTSRV